MHRAILAGVLLILCGSCAHTLPPAPHHVRFTPQFDRLPGYFELCWLEFDRTDAPGWTVTAGDTDLDKFEGTVSALLVKHPRGNYLIDTGRSSTNAQERKKLKFFARTKMAIIEKRMRHLRSAPEALKAIGVKNLRKIMLTHAHFDHAGGVVDLPKTRVLLPEEEKKFIAKMYKERGIHVVPAHAEAIKRNGIEEIRFKKEPYEVFDEHADLVGDGSIVVVKLPGHTPGSVGVFINLTPFARVFYVGDTVLATEGITRRRHKGFLMADTDYDREQTAATIAKLHQLQQAAPEIVIIPSHDRPAYQRFFGDQPRCFSVE